MDAPKTLGPEPETGIFGVGAAVAATHRQSVCDVQVGLRHAPAIHTRPLAQSVLTAQELLQLAGGMGVGVGLL